MAESIEASGPLVGIRVVELGVWVAGPAAAGILGDWGADVIKIEPPEGDPARKLREMFGAVLPSNPIFELDNRSKRSIALDLQSDDGLATALDLISTADVFITNLRRSALQRLGLDYESLAERFPQLIYGEITGFGRNGRDADKPGFDISAFWARAGIAHLLTTPGQDPPFQRGGMGDHNTGLAIAGAVSAALFERTRSGLGQLVSSSLFREGMYTIGFDLNTKLMWGTDIGVNDRFSTAATANNYQLADGARIWVIGMEADRHWPPLCRVCGCPELIDDPRFDTAPKRRENGPELIALLDEQLADLTLADVEARAADETDFFWARVNSLDDLLADPQMAASGALVDVPEPDGSTATMLATPVDYSRTAVAPRRTAPDIGEHGEEILAELEAQKKPS